MDASENDDRNIGLRFRQVPGLHQFSAQNRLVALHRGREIFDEHTDMAEPAEHFSLPTKRLIYSKIAIPRQSLKPRKRASKSPGQNPASRNRSSLWIRQQSSSLTVSTR